MRIYRDFRERSAKVSRSGGESPPGFWREEATWACKCKPCEEELFVMRSFMARWGFRPTVRDPCFFLLAPGEAKRTTIIISFLTSTNCLLHSLKQNYHVTTLWPVIVPYMSAPCLINSQLRDLKPTWKLETSIQKLPSMFFQEGFVVILCCIYSDSTTCYDILS